MDGAALLAMLQLADSAFPSGAYTLSGGLETLVEEGLVRGRGRASPAASGRCCSAGRPAAISRPSSPPIGRLAVAPPDLDAILAIDRRLEATKLAAEERRARGGSGGGSRSRRRG